MGALTALEVILTSQAKSALHHAVHGGLDQFNRRQHIGVKRGDPIVSVPIAKIARRRTAGIGHQDVWLRTCRQGFGAARFTGNVAGYRSNRGAAALPNFGRSLLQHIGIARHQCHVYAFGRQRLGATSSTTLLAPHHQRPVLPRNAEIHVLSAVSRKNLLQGCIKCPSLSALVLR